jgi:hypothetical protein
VRDLAGRLIRTALAGKAILGNGLFNDDLFGDDRLSGFDVLLDGNFWGSFED